MLATSPIKDSEEFAIHDYEDFGSVYISEYSGLEEVSKIAAFIAEHGEIGAEVLSQRGGSVEESQQLLEEGYHGEFDSEEDFTYYWTHEVDCIEIPDRLQYYIDYKSMARDWFMTDFLSVQIGQKVHVFSNC